MSKQRQRGGRGVSGCFRPYGYAISISLFVHSRIRKQRQAEIVLEAANHQRACSAARDWKQYRRQASIQAMDNIGVVRLKLTGCGQSLELEVENGETVGRLLDKCAEEMGNGVTRRHVKLVARGKNLDESSAQLSLEAAGIRDRTSAPGVLRGAFTRSAHTPSTRRFHHTGR